MLKIPKLEDLLFGNRVRWYGHVEGSYMHGWIKHCANLSGDTVRRHGRPKKTWKDTARQDLVDLDMLNSNRHDCDH